MKKSAFIIFIIAVFVLPFALLAKEPPAKDIKVKKLGTKKPAVTFSHAKHAKTKLAKDCNTCHNAVKAKNDAHKLCKDCHKAEKAGPTKCKECHK